MNTSNDSDLKATMTPSSLGEYKNLLQYSSNRRNIPRSTRNKDLEGNYNFYGGW